MGLFGRSKSSVNVESGKQGFQRRPRKAASPKKAEIIALTADLAERNHLSEVSNAGKVVLIREQTRLVTEKMTETAEAMQAAGSAARVNKEQIAAAQASVEQYYDMCFANAREDYNQAVARYSMASRRDKDAAVKEVVDAAEVLCVFPEGREFVLESNYVSWVEAKEFVTRAPWWK